MVTMFISCMGLLLVLNRMYWILLVLNESEFILSHLYTQLERVNHIVLKVPLLITFN
jgi:hypothetical protein